MTKPALEEKLDVEKGCDLFLINIQQNIIFFLFAC